jgi:hypothetical protein
MGTERTLLQRIYPTGMRVRLLPSGTAKLRIPRACLYGLIIKAIECLDRRIEILVELEKPDGTFASAFFDQGDFDPLPMEEALLRADLDGRKVHFPRSSGIGIDFPPGASDYGTICGVNLVGDEVKLALVVEAEGALGPSIILADFTQCDLLPRT